MRHSVDTDTTYARSEFSRQRSRRGLSAGAVAVVSGEES